MGPRRSSTDKHETLDAESYGVEPSGTSGSWSQETLVFLQTHGISRTPAELDSLLTEAVASLQQTLYRPDPHRDLTREETRVLERVGFELEPDLGNEDPLARSAAQYAALIKTGLSTTQAASILGVETSSVRRRLTSHPPTLYGIRLHSGWSIPRFQLDGDRMLPGLSDVVAQLDRELHPVAVYRWFTTPQPDLVPDMESEASLSPRDWLRLGFSPEKLAQLATDL